MAMRELLSAIAVVFSMGMTGSILAQDLAKGMKAYAAKDYATALKEWRLLAESGNAKAQLWLAMMYRDGEGVIQDYKESGILFRKAAEQGEVFAQTSLALMYENGQGVVQDYNEAVVWYRKVADQGDLRAQYNLGVMYKDGKGVVQDNVYSHMWYNIAASNDFKGASKWRDELSNKMTSEEIAKAQELARECVKKNYKGC